MWTTSLGIETTEKTCYAYSCFLLIPFFPEMVVYFCLSFVSLVIRRTNTGWNAGRGPISLWFEPILQSSQSGQFTVLDLCLFRLTLLWVPYIKKPNEGLLSSYSMSWELGFVSSKNILSGVHQPEESVCIWRSSQHTQGVRHGVTSSTVCLTTGSLAIGEFVLQAPAHKGP